MQSLDLIVVLTCRISHIILAITLHLGRISTKKIIVLHTKIHVNLNLVKRASRTANFFNVTETKNYWINIFLLGLIIAKVF